MAKKKMSTRRSAGIKRQKAFTKEVQQAKARKKSYSAKPAARGKGSTTNQHGDRFVTKADGSRVKVGNRGTGGGAGVDTRKLQSTKGLAGLARKNKQKRKKKN